MKRGGIFIIFFLFVFVNSNLGATNTLQDTSMVKRDVMHPVHISFTTVEYFEKDKKFRVLFKLFVDDFDLVLKQKYGHDLKLVDGKWEKSYERTINQYIIEHFKLVVDGKDRTKSVLKLTSHQVKEQAIWLYYDLGYKTKSEIFNIQNTLLMDLYPDQKNLLIFVFNEEQKAFQFDIKQKKQEIRF